ncbi:RidA family protein [Massilia sp. W12]|uniref:RidA family protein n=1 Tax=Massilia sp. W12 TaxID=3126507 RepID=UPI0030D62A24
MEFLSPPGWLRGRGYAHGVAAPLPGGARLVCISGCIGWDGQQCMVSDDFAAQAEQALQNVLAVLQEAGGAPQHIMRLTWYVLSREEYLQAGAALGAAYRRVLGSHYPAMSVLQVAGLLESRAKVEIEATALLPNKEGAMS